MTRQPTSTQRSHISRIHISLSSPAGAGLAAGHQRRRTMCSERMPAR